jgi:hypothetical protein
VYLPPVSVDRQHSVQTLLLSSTQADHDRARDLIAGLMTQHNGEYVFRLGSQPPRDKLFAGQLPDDSIPWTGIARTEHELGALRNAFTKTVEELRGKVTDTLHDFTASNLIASCARRRLYYARRGQVLTRAYPCYYDCLLRASPSRLRMRCRRQHRQRKVNNIRHLTRGACSSARSPQPRMTYMLHQACWTTGVDAFASGCSDTSTRSRPAGHAASAWRSVSRVQQRAKGKHAELSAQELKIECVKEW